MATIKEIADKAGVSIATVSKVLNGIGSISEDTRQTILNIAQDMNYRPNLHARSLKSKSSKTIGIITEDLTVFNSPEIVDGIASACENYGYQYLLGNLRLYRTYGNGVRDSSIVKKRTQELVDHMLSNQVEGIIYIGCHSHYVVNPSDHHGAKFVYAYCISKDSSVPSILYNEEKAAYEATQLLLKHRNAKPGMITGPNESIHTINRIKGYQRALFENNIPLNPSLSLTGDWDRDCGFTLGKELLDQGVNSIFVQNDLMAAGVIDYCNSIGAEIGKDVRLIGFDNREIASALRPKLSTVALPLFEIGEQSAIRLFDMLNGIENTENIVMLDCKLIERETTGKK